MQPLNPKFHKLSLITTITLIPILLLLTGWQINNAYAQIPERADQSPLMAVNPTTIVDSSPSLAIPDGQILAGEYPGFSTGIHGAGNDVIGINSQLHLDSDPAGQLMIGLQGGNGTLNDFIVIYIDTGPGGIPVASMSTPGTNPHEAAVGGFNFPPTGPPTDIDFTQPAIEPEFAIAMDQGQAILYQIPATGGGLLPITNLNIVTPNPLNGPWEINGFDMSMLGLTAGDSFDYIATYIKVFDPAGGYRYDQFHGVSNATVPPGDPGYGAVVMLQPNDFNRFQSYQTANIPPTATNDQFTTYEDTPLVDNIIFPLQPPNTPDSDGGDGGPLSVHTYTLPTIGTFNLLTPIGDFEYTPPLNYTGLVTFTYIITDGFALSNQATVTITIKPQGPTIITDTANTIAAPDAFIQPNEYAGYSGGINGFGNSVLGINSELHLDSNDSGDLMIGLKLGPGSTMADVVVIYFDTTAGGVPSISTDADQSTAGTAAITGLEYPPVGGLPVADIIFPPENMMDYALAIYYDTFNGGWLTELYAFTGGGGPLTTVFIGPVITDGPDPTTTTQLETLPLQLTMLGLSPGDSFDYIATYIRVQDAAGAYRYDQFHGVAPTTIPPGDPGYGSIVNLNSDDYNRFYSYASSTPTANDDLFTMNEDSTLTDNVITNPNPYGPDSAGSGGTLSIANVSSPTVGTLEMTLNGGFIYTPTANFFGTVTFTYQITNEIAVSAPALVTITVQAINDPPVAVNDTYTMSGNLPLYPTSLISDVTLNDYDVDDSLLNAELATSPTTGTLELHWNGTFTYTPPINYAGVVTFSYYLDDNVIAKTFLDTSPPAIVTINVITPVIAVNDVYTAEDDTIIQPAIQTVFTDTPNIAIPDDTYNGSLSSMACSTIDTTSLSTVPINDLFVELEVTHTWVGDLTVKLEDPANNILGLMSRPGYEEVTDTGDSCCGDSSDFLTGYPIQFNDDASIDAELMGNTIDGSQVVCRDDGQCFFSPNPDSVAGFNSLADFTGVSAQGNWQLCVGDSANSDIGTFIGWSLITEQPTGLLENDINGQSVTLITPPFTGTLDLRSNGYFTFTPPINFNGDITFTYQAQNGALLSNIALVTLTYLDVNDIPVAVDNSYNMIEDNTLVGNLITDDTGEGLDYDIEGDALFIETTAGVVGTLVISPDGSFEYTPPTNFFGNIQFTYQISDGLDISPPATVSITVALGDDDPPTPNPDNYTMSEDTTRNGYVLNNDSDPDNDPLFAYLAIPPTIGTFSFLEPNGFFTYTPPINFNGNVTFTYYVTSTIYTSTETLVTINVLPQNDPPVLTDASYLTDEDNAIINPLLITDPDSGESFTAAILTPPTSGTAIITNTTDWLYTPDNLITDYTITFTVKVTDSTNLTAIGTITVTVIADNDPLQAFGGSYLTDEDTPITGTISITDADTNDSYSFTELPALATGSFTINNDGNWWYTPTNQTATYTDTIFIEVNDLANSVTTPITITVIADNDPPIVTNGQYSAPEDNNITGNFITEDTGYGVDSDPDSPLLATISTSPITGTLIYTDDGDFTYIPPLNWSGTVTFEYTVSSSPPVAHWSFDEGVGAIATDSSSSGFDGTINGSAIFTTNVPSAIQFNNPYALQFDGIDDYVTIPDVGSYTELSLSWWSYLPVMPSGLTSIVHHDGWAGDYLHTFYNDTGRMTFAVNGHTPTNLTSAAPGITSSNLNQWVHFVMTYDKTSQTVTYYVDGVSLGSQTFSAVGTAIQVSPGQIGGWEGNRLFTGLMDDFRLYDYALSADDAMMLANGFEFVGATATITLTITPVNDPPLVANETYTTYIDMPLTVAAPGVLANDTDIDSATLTTTLLTGPTDGTLLFNQDGSFVYTPTVSGIFTFTYLVHDGNNDILGEATIDVNLYNCNVRLKSSGNLYGSTDASAVQTAATAATTGDTLQIAGYCAGVETNGGTDQTVRISKDLTLEGGYDGTNWAMSNPVLYTTTLDAGGNGRVVYIDAGNQVTITNITLLDGSSNGGSGGVILNLGTLEIIATSIISGYANNGGGIYNGGILTVTNSIITANTTTNNGPAGAGIRNNGTSLYVYDSHISDNNANMGGGIYADSPTIIVSSTIRDNYAANTASGLLNYSNMTVIDSWISHNWANNNGGGGILNYASITVTNSHLASNRGAGLMSQGNSANAYISNSSIYDNKAGSNAGGIYNNNGVTTILTNTKVYSNSAPVGGIFNTQSVLTITNSHIYSNTGNWTGGIYNNGANATLLMTNSSIYTNSNQTNTDGGAMVNNAGRVYISDTLIKDNDAGRQGGFLATANNSQTWITNSLIISNTASTYGGAFLNSASDIYITNTTLKGNHANAGGGVTHGGGRYFFENSAFINNTAGSGAGALSNSGGQIWLTNSTMSGNNPAAINMWAGGIAVTLTNVTIADNTYGIIGSVGTVTMQNSILANNSLNNCTRPIASLGHNLSTDTTCVLTATNDITNTPALLAPLADNGGATWTHALLSGSLAIDRISPLGLTVNQDQRGTARPQGLWADSGAYEYVGTMVSTPTLTLTVTSPPDAILSWSAEPNNCVYDLYHSNLPYTNWSIIQAELRTTMTQDDGALTPTTLNRYYLTAYGCGYSDTATTTTVASFSYNLTPGQ
ncbi:MAG TPA: Ig-like domain-containing protein [Anaerolineae bacterium]|nr:Ig-like domain-containing protein [Anaerolineae bacterium]